MTISRTFWQRVLDTLTGQRWYQVEVELGDGFLYRRTYLGHKGVVTEISEEKIPLKRN